MKESFIFYRSFYEALVGMDKQNQADCLMAIADYALNDKEPNLTPAVRMFFTLVKPQLDANRKRFENGKKGGRPKKEKNQTETKPKPKNNQTETKPEPNVNDNVNDNVNVNLNLNKNNQVENQNENQIEKNKQNVIDIIRSVSSKFNCNGIRINEEFSISKYEQFDAYVKEFDSSVIQAVERWIKKEKMGQFVEYGFITRQFFNFAKRQNKPIFKEICGE